MTDQIAQQLRADAKKTVQQERKAHEAANQRLSKARERLAKAEEDYVAALTEAASAEADLTPGGTPFGATSVMQNALTRALALADAQRAEGDPVSEHLRKAATHGITAGPLDFAATERVYHGAEHQKA